MTLTTLADGAALQRPIVLGTSGATLLGCPSGSRVRCNIGGGYAIVSRASRPGVVLGPSLVSGPGCAMRLGRGLPWPDLSAEPNMDFSGLSEWTFETFFQFASEPIEQKAIEGSQLNIGSAYQRVSQGVWAHSNRRLQIWWGGKHYETPPNVWSVGSVHHAAVVLHNETVRTFVNGQIVLEFPGTPTVPQLPGKAEVTCLGSNPSDPTGQNWLVEAPELWLDSPRWSNVARYWEAFSPPTSKLGVDSHTLLVLNNNDLDPDFLIGRVGNRGPLFSWILPRGTTQPQLEGILIRDISLDCLGTASGVCLEDTQTSRLENVQARYGVHGFHCPGATYNCSFRDLVGIVGGYGMTQGGAGMGTQIDGLTLNHGAIGHFVNGGVGGRVAGARFTPVGPALAAIYVYGESAMSYYDASVDIENAQQAPSIIAGAIIRQRPVRFFGGSIGTLKPGTPAKLLCDGGTTMDFGTNWFSG
jgi:hypothetical protein